MLYTNWDGNWKYYPDRPGGYSFECELVGFQTAYSALVPGDYEKCVTNFYGSHANWPKVRVVAKLDPAPVDPTDPPGGRCTCLERQQGLYRGQSGELQGRHLSGQVVDPGQ